MSKWRHARVIWMTPGWIASLHETSCCPLYGDTYVPSRPIGYDSLFMRLKAAWLVFRGQADALVWPTDDRRVYDTWVPDSLPTAAGGGGGDGGVTVSAGSGGEGLRWSSGTN